MNISDAMRLRSLRIRIIAVSYTHLDVYKRQAYSFQTFLILSQLSEKVLYDMANEGPERASEQKRAVTRRTGREQ